MDDKRSNEMEQIQRGLEAFLEKEINFSENGGARAEQNGRAEGFSKEETVSEPGQRRRDYREDDGAYADQEPEEPYPVRRVRRDTGPVRDGYDTRRMAVRNTSADYTDYGEEGEYEEFPERPRRAVYEDAEEEPEDWDAPGRHPSRERTRRAEEEERYDDGRPGRRYREEYDDRPVREREADRGRKRSEREEPPGRRKSGKAGQEDAEMAHRKPNAQTRKKKRKKKHRLLKLLIAVALIFALLGVGAYSLVGAVYGRMNYKEIASVSGAPMQEKGVVNILLIGNDSRENGEDGRSDAMILLSISSKTKKIYMTSLLRDMYVDIPGHDGNRLNAAYSFGGAELLMETIEQNFDISVNRYVLVNFEAFAGLVDAVDGIELELTSEEIDYVNGYLVEYNVLTDRPQGTDNMDTSVSGLVHLNGPQALAYSRIRYLGTDFGRTDRQRKVLTAVIKKLPSVLISNAGALMDGLLPNLTTNLTRDECFRLSLMAGKMLTYDIESDSIPQPGTYKDVTIRKMAVLEVDFETNIKYLKEKLYGE